VKNDFLLNLKIKEGELLSLFYLVIDFVMAIGILCRGHRFAFADPYAIDYVTLAVNYAVTTALGAGIAAI